MRQSLGSALPLNSKERLLLTQVNTAPRAAPRGTFSMHPPVETRRRNATSLYRSQSGVTLVELVIVVAILGILASAAVPVARFQVKRDKERELRRDLWEMRAAIDRYKDAADKGNGIINKVDALGYPPDLQTLVDGVDIRTYKVRFLRRIPIDPMTGTYDWGIRSNQDDLDSDSWGGQNVFDVHTKSMGKALDGSTYNTW